MDAELRKFSGTSDADTDKTVSTSGSSNAGGEKLKLLYVTVKYSASPTQAGVTTTLNSGLGAAFDAVLNTGSANAQTTVYVPDGNIIIDETDQLDVTAPAGGGVITSSICIMCERVY